MSNIHPTAIVDPRAEIDATASIGPYSVIGAHVVIGAGTTVGPHCVIDGRTTLGRDNHIFQFNSIGAIPQDKKYAGEPTELVIGDRNTIREFCTLNLGVPQAGGITTVGNLLPDEEVDLSFETSGKIVAINFQEGTVVRKGATLGANCTIVCGATVGEYAFIGAGAVVNKDVPAYALVVGVPARQIGWMSEYGEQLDLPLHGESEATCPHTGACYALNGASVIRLSA